MAAFENEIDPDLIQEEDIPSLEVPVGGEDYDGAAAAKDSANEAKSSGNYDLAIEQLTKALELGNISAITLANRADCLLCARRPLAALSDCNAALNINPDSCKALKIRGKVNRHLGKWEAANKDLAAAQSIDFDPDLVELCKLVHDKTAALESQKVQQRLADEEVLREKVRKQREDIAKRRQEEEEEEERQRAQREEEGGMGGFPGGMPGGMGGMPGGMGGMPGGMGGMPGGMGGGAGGMDGLQGMLMQLLMSDPELSAGMKNPKVMKAFTAMMGGGAADPSAMDDPEVKVFMAKLTEKLGPLMGMMGGGMGGGGGMNEGGMPDEEDEDKKDMPDLEPTSGHVEEVD